MQNSSRQMMWSTVMLVLLLRVGSSSRCFLMILMAGSMGMDVNSALTPYDMMHSSGWSLMFLMLSRNSLLFCTWWWDLPTRGLMIFAYFFTSLWMTKVSSTYLHQNVGGVEQCLALFVPSTPCRGWLQWDWLGNPWLHPQPVHRTGLGKKCRCSWDKTPIGE